MLHHDSSDVPDYGRWQGNENNRGRRAEGLRINKVSRIRGMWMRRMISAHDRRAAEEAPPTRLQTKERPALLQTFDQ